MIKKLTALIVTGAFILVGATPAMAYTVEKGDTMFQIAQDHSMSLSSLSDLNPQVEDINLIYIGDEINTKTEKAVTASSKADSKPDTKVNTNTSVTSNELDLMARLVRAEALGEPYKGKVAVAEVVLNRVESNGFPNSISGVIYDRGQFSPVTNGSISTPADSESIKAVKEAVSSDGSIVGDSLFFYNPDTASSRWLDSKPTKHVISNHTFK